MRQINHGLGRRRGCSGLMVVLESIKEGELEVDAETGVGTGWDMPG